MRGGVAFAAALVLVAGLGAPAGAQTAATRSAEAPAGRMLGDAEAAGYRGVGRLNVAGARFCTATLISETRVLTAAHCLYHPVSKRMVGRDRLRFVAGQRRDSEAAVRGIARIAVLPGFEFDPAADMAHVARDMALLELDAPVPGEVAEAFPVTGFDGGRVARIVSYSRERAYVISAAGPCGALAAGRGILTLDCAVRAGASGAPVLVGPRGAERVMAVVSAMGVGLDGREVALTVIAAPNMVALERVLAE